MQKIQTELLIEIDDIQKKNINERLLIINILEKNYNDPYLIMEKYTNDEQEYIKNNLFEINHYISIYNKLLEEQYNNYSHETKLLGIYSNTDFDDSDWLDEQINIFNIKQQLPLNELITEINNDDTQNNDYDDNYHYYDE